ncbi:MAG TPA: hypothetical protein VFT87_00715 [Candidatus Saccharimonadales bacterium]|nr:hypothetical protein [Candidatus Saccharimonadales bacterium]
MGTIQIDFDDVLATLAHALKQAKSNKVEVAFCLKPSNKFTVIDGDHRTTWQVKLLRMSDPTWNFYSLLTHILNFADDVYHVFNEALNGDRQGWVVVIVTPEGVSAEHRTAL